jgi:hypothetical protein
MNWLYVLVLVRINIDRLYAIFNLIGVMGIVFEASMSSFAIKNAYEGGSKY